MRYSFFTVGDFCKDAEFIKWAVTPTAEDNAFWSVFLETHPHKREEVQLALEYIRTIHFEDMEPDKNDLLALKDRIWQEMDSPSSSAYRWLSWRYFTAASLILMCMGGLWWSLQKSPIGYRTGYGEVREIKLDDGSRVLLNGHSEIKVNRNIANSQVREVWLRGEANFEIAKRKGAKFIVHTAETKVEVLGTTFNVNARRRQTRVVLEEGKVQLVASGSPAWVLRPGEMATVDKDSRVRLTKVQPGHYNAWKKSFMVMDDKLVSEIIEVVEDNYGLTIQFEDSTLLNKRLSGKLAIKNPDQFLENLSTILERELIRTEDGYIFR